MDLAYSLPHMSVDLWWSTYLVVMNVLEGAGTFQHYQKDAEQYPFPMVWHLAVAEVNEEILLNLEQTEFVAVVHSNKSAFHLI